MQVKRPALLLSTMLLFQPASVFCQSQQASSKQATASVALVASHTILTTCIGACTPIVGLYRRSTGVTVGLMQTCHIGHSHALCTCASRVCMCLQGYHWGNPQQLATLICMP